VRLTPAVESDAAVTLSHSHDGGGAAGVSRQRTLTGMGV